MYRRIATTLTATAILAGSAAIAQADLGITPIQANTATMVQSIQSQLTGKAFGWEFAITQNGQLSRTSAGVPAGFAASAADTGGTNVGSHPTRRMQIMSATKTFTAISTLMLLRANNLTIDSPVAPYLPSSWIRDAGFKPNDANPIRFRHLLSHTSGFAQKLAAVGDSHPSGNGWDLLKWLVQYGTIAGSERSYKNANYAMLGLLNAELWKRSGGAITVPVYDPVTHQYSLKTLPVDKSTMGAYKLSHMRKRIFEPLGIENVSCKPTDSIYEMRGYAPFATSASKGSLIVTSDEECAGHAGLRLSAIEMVNVLAELRHGTLLHPSDRALMDSDLLGWDDRTSSAGVFSHGGDAIDKEGDGPEVHTCNITFPDGTEAAIIVNSRMVNGAPYQCTILRNAWNAAR